MTRCACCEIRKAEVTCKSCGRTVCSECLTVTDKNKCYCHASCAEFERDWHSKHLKK